MRKILLLKAASLLSPLLVYDSLHFVNKIHSYLSRYRERFKMKYPCHMNTKNWKFVKDGLDDFRDGLPPSHDDIMLEVNFY